MPNKVALETLALNNVDIVVSTDNKLFVNDIRQADSINIDSVDSRVAIEESTEAAQVSSIDTRVAAEETARSTDVDSIDTRVSLEESTEAAKIASIDTRLGMEENTTQVATLALASGAESVEVNFSSDLSMMAFYTTPAVAAMMRNTDADASIIIPMLVGEVSTTGCKFVFSDNIVGDNYKMDIIVTD